MNVRRTTRLSGIALTLPLLVTVISSCGNTNTPVATRGHSLADAMRRLEYNNRDTSEAVEEISQRFDKIASTEAVNDYRADLLEQRLEALGYKYDPNDPAHSLEAALEGRQRLLVELQSARREREQVDALVRDIVQIRSLFTEARKTLHELNTIRNKLLTANRALITARSTLRAAQENNGSLRREALLYTFGFKGLGGAFTGYLPTTEFLEQEIDVAQRAQYAQELADGVRPQLASLAKTLQKQLDNIVELVRYQETGATNFQQVFRLGGGLNQLVELIRRHERAGEHYYDVQLDFEELVTSGVLRPREVNHYFGSSEFSIENDISFGARYDSSATGGRTEFLVTQIYDECYSAAAHSKIEKELQRLKTGDNGQQQQSVQNNSGNCKIKKNGEEKDTDYATVQWTSPQVISPFFISMETSPGGEITRTTTLSDREGGNEQARVHYLLLLEQASEAYERSREDIRKIYTTTVSEDGKTVDPSLLEKLFDEASYLDHSRRRGEEVVASLRKVEGIISRLQADYTLPRTHSGEELLTYHRIEDVATHPELLPEYTPEQNEEILQNYRNAYDALQADARSYVAIRDIMQSAINTRDIYREIESIVQQRRAVRDRVVMAELALERAGEENGRKGKELVWYLFGFKWLGGIFTGGAPSVDTKAEEEDLAQAKAEEQEWEQSIKHRLERLKIHFRNSYRQTMRLAMDARKVIGANRFTEGVQAFINDFINVFNEMQNASENFQDHYALFLEELLQSQHSYQNTGEHERPEELEKELSDGVQELLRTNRLDKLITLSATGSQLELDTKILSYNRAFRKYNSARVQMEQFFSVYQSQMLANYLQYFDEDLVKYNRLRSQVELILARQLNSVDITLLRLPLTEDRQLPTFAEILRRHVSESLKVQHLRREFGYTRDADELSEEGGVHRDTLEVLPLIPEIYEIPGLDQYISPTLTLKKAVFIEDLLDKVRRREDV